MTPDERRQAVLGLLATHSGRMPDEVAHELAAGPLDRADWPDVGDEVLA